jgi:hypothetical protein
VYIEGPIKLIKDEQGLRHYIDDPVRGLVPVYCGTQLKVIYNNGLIEGRYESSLTESDSAVKLYDPSGAYIIIPEGSIVIKE